MDWIVKANNPYENVNKIVPSCAFNCPREIPPPSCPDAFCIVEFGGPPCSDRGCLVLIGG
ncbi:MAG: hypothetical protein WCZ27_11095 [Tissierellaceae bacterium]